MSQRKGGGIRFVEDGNDDDMYGGGRRGVKREWNDGQGDEDSDESEYYTQQAEEKKEKQERHQLIMNEFKKRRGGSAEQGKERRVEEEKDDFIPPDPDCPLRDAGSQRIPKLTVKAREHCLGMLESVLKANFIQQYQDIPHRLAAADYEPICCAIDEEYRIFHANRLANTYKAGIMKVVAEIKKCTAAQQLHPSLTPSWQESGRNMDLTTPPDTNGVEESDLGCLAEITDSEMTNSLGLHDVKQKWSVVTEGLSNSVLNSTSAGKSCDLSSNILSFLGAGEADNRISGHVEGISKSDVSNKNSKMKNSTTPNVEDSVTAKTLTENLNLNEKFVTARTLSENLHSSSNDFNSEPGPLVLDSFIPINTSLPNPDIDNYTSSSNAVIGFYREQELQEEKLNVSVINKTEVKDVPEGQQVPRIKYFFETEEYKAQQKQRTHKQRDKEDNKSSKRPAQSTRSEDKRRPKLNENQKPGSSSDVKIQPINLKESADLVVKYLSPYFKAGKIASKDLFKAVARGLSHKLAKGTIGQPTNKVKDEAKRMIKEVFTRLKEIKSEVDIQNL
ncbi:hypothetical protein CHS0354_041862 [Potamilus streckersoni]|uniref:Set2 Rpb1 interacting domain-containing protein n=1 Tax=Potamilus streckersoni TaxID=2493646 RepID=A0AAE0W1A3_9BIVA|nr:hypothetical protein CHS0354_041862 [Potamilus streckersoni]